MQLDDLLSFPWFHLLTFLILRVHLYYMWLLQMPMINKYCDSLACVVGIVFPMGAFAI